MSLDLIEQDIVNPDLPMSQQGTRALENLRHDFNRLAAANRRLTPIRDKTPAREFLTAYAALGSTDKTTLLHKYSMAKERMEANVPCYDNEREFKHRLVMSFFGLFAVIVIMLTVAFVADMLLNGSGDDTSGGPLMEMFRGLVDIFKLLFSI